MLILSTVLAGILSPSALVGDEPSNKAAEIFRTRIVPLLESPDPSSCSQCHLRGVELKDFISTDPAKTFTELRGRGWINVEQPEKSKLLEFIQRGAEDLDPLRQRVQQAEFAAMKTWIEAAVREPSLLNQPLANHDDLTLPIEFIRHARRDHVLARFSEAIWSQLQRCAHCHSPERNAKQVAKHGEQMTWIVPNQPAATLALLTERKLINVDDPDQSKLRTKPLSLVEHGGGPKFPIASRTDQMWRDFITDYAKLVRGGYAPDTKLPPPLSRRSWLSEMQLKITDLPEEWRGRLLTVSLHRINAAGEYDEEATAIGDGTVARRTLVWQASLNVFETIHSNDATVDWSKPLVASDAIPAGRYQIQIRLGHLVVSEEFRPVVPDGPIGKPVLVAADEVEAPWPLGYQPPKIVSYSRFTRLDQQP